MTAKERAQERATAQMRTKQQPAGKQLTTAEDLLRSYSIKYLTTTLENHYQIQKVYPGTYMIITGSPLVEHLANIESDTTDDAAAMLDELPDQAKSRYLQFMQRIVCAGVVSLNLTCDKRQPKCNDEKKELSVDVIPGEDLIELYNEIMALSLPENEVETVDTFPETSPDQQACDDTDTPTDDAIPPTAE